jgi:hypothetical protein
MIPCASPKAKAQAKALPSCGYGAWHWLGTHMALCGPCVRVGEGFGGFLGLREKVFLILCRGDGLSPCRSSFFMIPSTIYVRK